MIKFTRRRNLNGEKFEVWARESLLEKIVLVARNFSQPQFWKLRVEESLSWRNNFVKFPEVEDVCEWKLCAWTIVKLLVDDVLVNFSPTKLWTEISKSFSKLKLFETCAAKIISSKLVLQLCARKSSARRRSWKFSVVIIYSGKKSLTQKSFKFIRLKIVVCREENFERGKFWGWREFIRNEVLSVRIVRISADEISLSIYKLKILKTFPTKTWRVNYRKLVCGRRKNILVSPNFKLSTTNLINHFYDSNFETFSRTNSSSTKLSWPQTLELWELVKNS